MMGSDPLDLQLSIDLNEGPVLLPGGGTVAMLPYGRETGATKVEVTYPSGDTEQFLLGYRKWVTINHGSLELTSLASAHIQIRSNA